MLKDKVEGFIAGLSQNQLADLTDEWGDEADIGSLCAMECVMEEGGGEGGAEHSWAVWRFYTDTEEVFVKFIGSYYSYDGTTFESWRFVSPKQQTVTVYN